MALPGVERAELIAPAESAKRLEQALGADAALLDGVELDALPGSVEVTLAPGVRDVIAMSPTLRALRGTSGVDDVVLEPARDAIAAPRRARSVRSRGPPRACSRCSRSSSRSRRSACGSSAIARSAGACTCSGRPGLRGRADRARGRAARRDRGGARGDRVWIGVARCGDAIALSALSIEIGFPAASAVLAFVTLGAAAGLVGGGLAGGARVAR